MTEATKKKKIKALANWMLKDSLKKMEANIDRALNSGALDIDDWDENSNPMILPKIIVKALIEDEARQYDGRGTSHEKMVKKEVANLKNFL